MNKNTLTSYVPFVKKDAEPAVPKQGSTKTQVHNGVTWTDLENPSQEELAKLAQDYNLHALHIEECISRRQLPQLETEKEYVFLLLYFPKYIAAEDRIVSSHVGIFLGKDFLLTVHEDSSPTIRNLFAICEQDSEKREQYFKKSAGYLLYGIIDVLLHDLSDSIHHVLKDLNEIEEQVFDSKDSDAYQIGLLRQKIMKLRRIIVSLKELLGEISTGINDITGESLARYYHANAKSAGKLWEMAEEARETIEIYKDADFTTSTQKTNAILAVLTLLFTLSIPATVLGAFYGMNVLLPGGISTGSWTFLGAYTTFKAILLLSGASGFAMFLYFRKKRWF